jgi:hypothetical protein
MKPSREWSRWTVVIVFAIAMAWVEAAVVLYLRTLVSRLDPYQPHPLPMASGLGEAELAREAATLVMLTTVGWLAGRTWRSRIAYALVGFGIWDIFYYSFLIPLTGWPRSWLDWDILFLIPLPWWGPVLAPVLIAGLMVMVGSLVALADAPDRPLWPGRLSVVLNLLGGLLALYVFMADALRVAGQGGEALRNLLPTEFHWVLFGIAWLLMSAAGFDIALQAWMSREKRLVNEPAI